MVQISSEIPTIYCGHRHLCTDCTNDRDFPCHYDGSRVVLPPLAGCDESPAIEEVL